MRYTLINTKKSIHAKKHSDFVKWMRKNDIQEFDNNQEFIKEYSRRKFLFENIELSVENENSFVSDLQKNNLLKIEKFPVDYILGLLKI